MDDFVLWSGEREELKAARERVAALVAERLGLELKDEPYLNRTRHGMDFLGMRVFPDVVRLNRRSKERFAEKARRYGWLLAQGRWTERTYQERMTALTAFAQQADSLAWRKSFFRKPAPNVGLEPEHPWRELEQQRQQRALRQQQLEQPGQRQQQQRLPVRLPLSTAETLEERMGSPPVSCFRRRNEERMAS